MPGQGGGVLSRIAESLFWTGRYVERADDIARILDVHLHHLLEDPTVDESTACSSLLAAMGVAAGNPAPDAASVTEKLAFDHTNPSSIASSLVSARANARGISEVISSEMWEALNVTYNDLGVQVQLGRQEGPHAFFGFVRERAALLAGLADSTMCKDDAWHFLVLGRSLERVDMLARLLSTEVAHEPAKVDWVTLLRSCSGHEAFLRTYRSEPEPGPALEFLLRERLFPRSILCALLTAEDCLRQLDHSRPRPGFHDEASRLVAEARTHLEFRPVDDMLHQLFNPLAAVQAGVSRATESLATRYFRQTRAIEWHVDQMEAPSVPGQTSSVTAGDGAAPLSPPSPPSSRAQL
jgi:uncharacterized alpha-E superfamily protein